MNTVLLLVTLILAYVMVKRWADKPTPAKPVMPADTKAAQADIDRATDGQQVGSSWHTGAMPWLIFFGCASIFGVEVSAVIVATVYAAKLGVRLARQRAAQRSRLIADAIKQHNQVVSGDDAGIYGNYPPSC